MTIGKAKLYRTAQIIESTEHFKAGEFVAVSYKGFTNFGGMFFVCTNGNRTETVSQCSLDNFVL